MASPEKRLRHAVAQDKYHRKRMQTHAKVCVWIKHEHIEAFKKSLERLKKKFA